MNDWFLVSILTAVAGAASYVLLRLFAFATERRRPAPPAFIVSAARPPQRILHVTRTADGTVLVDVREDGSVWLSSALTLDDAHDVIRDLALKLTKTYGYLGITEWAPAEAGWRTIGEPFTASGQAKPPPHG